MLEIPLTAKVVPLILAGWMMVMSPNPLRPDNNASDIYVENRGSYQIIHDYKINDSEIRVYIDKRIGKIIGVEVYDDNGCAGWSEDDYEGPPATNEELQNELKNFVRPDQKKGIERWEKQFGIKK